MTVIHAAEVRDMTPAERQAELEDLETELLNAVSAKAAGAQPENPGRIKELRKAIARIKTIQNEEGDSTGDESPEYLDETGAEDE